MYRAFFVSLQGIINKRIMENSQITNTIIDYAQSVLSDKVSSGDISPEKAEKAASTIQKGIPVIAKVAGLALAAYGAGKVTSTAMKIGLGIAEAALGSSIGKDIGKQIDKSMENDHPYCEDALSLIGGIASGSVGAGGKAIGKFASTGLGRTAFGLLGGAHAMEVGKKILEDDPSYSTYDKAKDMVFVAADLGAMTNMVNGARRSADRFLTGTKWDRHLEPQFKSLSTQEAKAVADAMDSEVLSYHDHTWSNGKGSGKAGEVKETKLDKLYKEVVKPFVQAVNNNIKKFNAANETKQELYTLPTTKEGKYQMCVDYIKRAGIDAEGNFVDPMGTEYKFNIFDKTAKIKGNNKWSSDHFLEKQLETMQKEYSKQTNPDASFLANTFATVDNWVPMLKGLNDAKGSFGMDRTINWMRRFVNATDQASLHPVVSAVRYSAPAAAVTTTAGDILRERIDNYAKTLE